MIDLGHPAKRHIRAALSASLDAVGLPTSSSLSDSAQDRELLGLPAVERVCFVLADGLGWFNLQSRIGHAPTLRAWNAEAPISSAVPSTTAAAITTICTGELPGRTSMLSYELRSPHTGRGFSLITWEKSGLDPSAWQPEATIFERLGERSTECAVVQQRKFVGSGLTLCAYRGAHTVMGESLEDRVSAAARALRSGKRAAYIYWRELDHVGHGQGCESDAWIETLEEFDAGMRCLARSVPRGTLIVLTADHGMLDIGERLDIAECPELLADVDCVSGEERARHLYTGLPEAVATRWREELGEAVLVMTKDEFIATGALGEPTEHARSVMGDVIVCADGSLSLFDSRGREPGRAPMIGVHGSLTDVEMRVPFLVEMV